MLKVKDRRTQVRVDRLRGESPPHALTSQSSAEADLHWEVTAALSTDRLMPSNSHTMLKESKMERRVKNCALFLGYARVSKAAAQVKALRQAGCKRIFEEKPGGGRSYRQELHKTLEQLREGDLLVLEASPPFPVSKKTPPHIME